MSLFKAKHIKYYQRKQFNRLGQNQDLNILLKIGAGVLVYGINFFIFLFKIFNIFFKFLIYKPFYRILRFIFYKIIVKFYSLYYNLIKKIGWKKFEDNFFSFLFNQKLVHILVIFISSFLIFLNFSQKTSANEISNKNRKTMLSDLVKTEFADFDEEEDLVLESFNENTLLADEDKTYMDNSALINPTQKIVLQNKNQNKEETQDHKAQRKIVKKRDKIITYTVQRGDSISTIARKFGIKVKTILWENNLSSYSIIRPGDKLRILPIDGVTHKVKNGENLSYIAKKYDTEAKEILKANKLADASYLKIGQELLIPNGKKITTTYKPKTYSGFTAIQKIVKAPNSTNITANKMAWPTVGHRITQYFSWRHNGLDIANKIGTPIYAADAGVVEFAKWGRGYGMEILINHGGGKKTRYAHLSKFFVKKGQKVSKGETIGAMGSTGWSTGPHIHFEVIINGKRYNPLNYIK